MVVIRVMSRYCACYARLCPGTQLSFRRLSPCFRPRPATIGSKAAANDSTSTSDAGFRDLGQAPFSARSASPEDAAKILQQLQELAQESLKLSVETGPRGLVRGVQAVRAVASVAQEYISRGQSDPPERILRQLFEKLGATYVKLGQFIASSPSLFPDEYVKEFQKCLDQTDPVPFSDIMKTIKEELDVPVDQVFSYIDPAPLASASVAQVHRAVLRGSDKEVVLKVLKPGVEDTLVCDLNFLYLATRLLQLLNPALERISLLGIVEDIRISMLDEVDFVKEAAHVREFSAYLDSMGMRAFATCPYVYSQYSTRRLLTMEKLQGVSLTDLDAIRSVTAADPEATLINALNTWFGSVLYCSTFHADVHAGNLLVQPDGRVGFIDFGIVGTVSPVTWKAVEALLASTASGDYRTMARALATMKATNATVDVDAFAKDLEALFNELKGLDSEIVVSTAGGTMSSVSADVVFDDAQVNRLFLEIYRVGELHGIKFPREFGLLLKQILYFDRYIRLLAPELEVLNDSRVSIGNISGINGNGTKVSFR